MTPNEKILEKSPKTSPAIARALAGRISRAIVLPIVERELRLAARRPKTYYGRMAAAATWIAVAGYGLLVTYSMRVRMYDGQFLFQALSFVLFGWALCSAWAGCDSISAEKREGTIGFLFLTDLKSHDIVLGKMAAAALPWLYAALAVLPLLAICTLMGGVTAAQYTKTGLAILDVFFLSQAIGMFCSALCRLRGNSTGLPLLILLLYLIGCGVTYGVAQARHWNWLATLSNWNNPAHALYLAMSRFSARGVTWDYWLSLLAVHLQAWIFLGLAIRILPFRWRENPKKAGLWKRTWERWRYGSLAARAARRRWLLSVHPFLWLVCRRRVSPPFVWGVLAVFVAGLSYFPIRVMLEDAGGQDYAGCFALIIILLQLLLRVSVPSYAGLLEEHRRNGSLEIILCCSPLTEEEILEGMWLLLRRYYFRPLVFVVVLEGVTFIVSLVTGLLLSKVNIEFLLFIFVSTIMLAFDLRAMAWMAMWTAMSNPKPRSSAPTALFWICLVPWMFVGLCYGAGLVRKEYWLWILWPAFGLMIDGIGVWLAQELLRKNFRLWAVPSYGERLGFLARAGRLLGLLLRRWRQDGQRAA